MILCMYPSGYLQFDNAAVPYLDPILQARQQHGHTVGLADQPRCVRRKQVSTTRT